MKKIQTVTGAIAPEDLGFCQSHEHLCLLDGQSARCNPALRIDDLEASALELEDYFQAGGRAVVDAQPVGCGRDAEFLKKVSARSGVNIIASTGFHKLIFYPENHWIFSWTEERLAQFYIQELTKGMFMPCDSEEPYGQTDILAGQIKTALDREGLTPRYKTLFAAAVQAQKATGAALMVHTEAGVDARDLADYLEALGADLSHVIFCHMDRTEVDLSVHAELCRRGIAMEYDTIAREKYHDNCREIEIVRALLDSGFQSQLLMSLDVTRARLIRYGGQVGLGYILNVFLDYCKDRGISGGVLRDAFYNNPSKYFSMPSKSESSRILSLSKTEVKVAKE